MLNATNILNILKSLLSYFNTDKWQTSRTTLSLMFTPALLLFIYILAFTFSDTSVSPFTNRQTLENDVTGNDQYPGTSSDRPLKAIQNPVSTYGYINNIAEIRNSCSEYININKGMHIFNTPLILKGEGDKVVINVNYDRIQKSEIGAFEYLTNSGDK